MLKAELFRDALMITLSSSSHAFRCQDAMPPNSRRNIARIESNIGPAVSVSLQVRLKVADICQNMCKGEQSVVY